MRMLSPRKLVGAGSAVVLIIVCLKLATRNSEDAETNIGENSKYALRETASRSVIKRTKVIVMAYYRSGSSFMGELFGENPEAFYLFEPLTGYRDTMVAVANSSFGGRLGENDYVYFPTNSSFRPFPRSKESLPMTETMRDIFRCDIDQLRPEILSGKFFLSGQHMPKVRDYIKCIKEQSRGKNPGPEIYSKCTASLKKFCDNSTIIAAKTLRYPMHLLPDLLDKDPDLKIIHYVRDPRAIMLSRAQINRNTIQLNGKPLCLKLMSEQRYFRDLQRRYPNNCLMVKYEDLALRPEYTARLVYDFVGHVLPNHVHDWLEKNTKTKKDDWKFGTKRNSQNTVFKWRSANASDIKRLTFHCSETIKYLGYQK